LGYRGEEGLERLPEVVRGTDSTKVESFSRVSQMSILGWASASNGRAVANARAAAVECSRRRVERAEVAQAVAELTAGHAAASVTPAASSVGRAMRMHAHAR
jgi:hypothetical protein